MICAWDDLISILPAWIGREVDNRYPDTLQELRLRLGMPPQVVLKDRAEWLSRNISAADLNFCINTASRYSPWTAQTASQGYITVRGGHRIGICGNVIIRDGAMMGIQTVRSLCIRVARDFPNIAQHYSRHSGSILIIGPPGSGKTTFLRDLIRQISHSECISVVDERGELFPEELFGNCKSLDVLSGCPKTIGIDILLRTMGPKTIAVDEITAAEDCAALQRACWCGVRLIATAHAATISDLRSRHLYKPLLSENIFKHILIMHCDKTIHEERIIP